MLSPLFSLILIPLIIAIFLAINMGGSGTAPAFSAAVGANVIRKNLVPGIFGVMVFLGAIIAGKGTANTIGKGLLPADYMDFTIVSIILFSVAMALLLANIFGVPQSTSQATVMAVVAPAAYYNELNTHKLFVEIIPTWLIMPIISFIICYLLGRFLYKPIRKRGWTMSSKINRSPILKGIIVLMACYVAFSIGSNNVANAAGPVTTMVINELGIDPMSSNFTTILILVVLIIAPSFAIGSSIFGNKLLQNTGKEIILFGRFEAVIISFVSASLLLLVSITKGIPTSLVQLNVAAIIGIGVAKLGAKHIFRKTQVNRFFVMWLVSPAIAFGLSYMLTTLFDNFNIHV
ncbi:MAG: inorganic phosphate transporter [Bacteroidales bacterium]|jgi:sulfate permease|nr:inorganic phosphate transporter [Bacteroidales bacterium]